jgi:hypothetical protein
MSDKEDIPAELQNEDSVYDAPAARLHEIFLALKRQGFTKAQAEGFVAELVPDEFRA